MLRAAERTPGWTPEDGPRFHAGEEIYDHMDGAGEIPLACGFRRMGVLELRRESGALVAVELYDMGSSANAFGLASLWRAGAGRTLETTTHPADLSAGRLVLWKDRFTAVLVARDANPASEAALVELGHSIDAAIDPAGEPPDLLRLLPDEGRAGRSERYFRGKFALDTLWFRPENVFALDGGTEAAYARYEEPEARLLLVRYPDEASAGRALATAREALGATEAVDLSNGIEAFAGETAGLLQRGDLLVAVLSAPDRSAALARLEAAAACARAAPPVRR